MALESDRFDVAAATVINASSFVNGSDVTDSRDLTLQSLISYISLSAFDSLTSELVNDDVSPCLFARCNDNCNCNYNYCLLSSIDTSRIYSVVFTDSDSVPEAA